MDPAPSNSAQLLDTEQLCAQLNVSRSWVYKRTRKGAPDPLPVIRIGGLKFDAERVREYIATRQPPPAGAKLTSSDGNARVDGKRYRSLTRRRFQNGSVRLRKDRTPPWWEGFYREDVVDESGQIRRKRKSVNLGLLADVPTKRAALRNLGKILAEINDADYRPRSTITFSAFLKRYWELKMPTKKGTTQRGYAVNQRKHFLPFFGEMQLSDIDTETVQAFLNNKITEGYSYNTLKNLKWGLSSVFAAAVKYDYIKLNPVPAAELPPEDIREEATLPQASQLELLIAHLPDPLSEAVWLAAITCIRPEELAFKWSDLDPVKCHLWIVRAVNRGKLHTPKYHRVNRPIQLTESDVQRLLALKQRISAADHDWMFPNKRRTGPIGHEQIMGRVVQPIARRLGLPHITWRILRHWGTTQMMENRVPIKAAQQRLGHSRPDILLKHYTHLLEESAEFAAETLSGKLSGNSEKTSESTQDSPPIGSQTAAKSKRWVM